MNVYKREKTENYNSLERFNEIILDNSGKIEWR